MGDISYGWGLKNIFSHITCCIWLLLLQAKAAIRSILPAGLQESISKVRTSVAYAVSAIASWDWPEAWPELFGILMQALTSSNHDAVHGAMRVLTGKTQGLLLLSTEASTIVFSRRTYKRHSIAHEEEELRDVFCNFKSWPMTYFWVSPCCMNYHWWSSNSYSTMTTFITSCLRYIETMN